MFVIYNRNLAAKVLKIIEVYKAKIAVSEGFALAVTFFALAVSRPASTFRQLMNIQPQITDFKHRKTCHWNTSKGLSGHPKGHIATKCFSFPF